MLAVFKKEFKSYFYSPMAYIVIGLFIVVTSFIFCYFFLPQGDFTPMLDMIVYLQFLLVPMLTMRLLTEDRKNGTESLLLTSPTKLASIVVGKYLAALAVFMAMVALSWVYPLVLLGFGGVVTAKLVGGYVGYVLIGAAFIAFGLFASSLTENQFIAAVITIVGLLVIQLAETLASSIEGFVGKVFDWFSLLARFRIFIRGVFDIVPIVYLLSFIVLFVFLTVRDREAALELARPAGRKWLGSSI